MDIKQIANSGCLSPTGIEEYYAQYLKDPSVVAKSWKELFDHLDKCGTIALEPPTADEQKTIAEKGDRSVLYYPRVAISSSGGDGRIHRLIDAYRAYGHLYASTNPIAMDPLQEPPQLNLESLGFTKQELSQRFPSCGLFPEETAPLLDIINALKNIYCGSVGIEYVGMHTPEMEAWIQQHIEPSRFRSDLTKEQKKAILQQLNKSELLELFLHTKYVGQKRFSLEGAETLIPMLATVIDSGTHQGIDEYIIGMSHRGRLNVLSNILDKSYGEIFSEFDEGDINISVEGSGDVKYHKGFYSEIKNVHGHDIKLTVVPNPSHLESVNAVVEGETRARQVLRQDDKKEKVIPILIHGDGAISGQGVVYETLQLSRLEGYNTGGTIHIVVNNQIAFTTVPKDQRSTYYCTDIAHMFSAPVFHVNAEDPETCVYVANLAVALRQAFHCDVFIELNCYRKYGHNEGDEPAYTQPLEYAVIRKKKSIRELYRDALIEQNILDQSVVEALEAEFKASLQSALKMKTLSKPTAPLQEEALATARKAENIFQPIDTKVDIALLQQIAERLCCLPEEFAPHPKLATLLQERRAMVDTLPGKIDWGMGELLAYGSLVWQGIAVRLTGQDCCRGTFSHRHAMLMDQKKEQAYIPLQHMKKEQGRFDIYNSPLSEYAALGFEFGYSVASPKTLVIWEAQFGDFCNTAQVIIDQYIATSEQKWNQKVGITLFLPHGYEGQGPEHSSGRMERFLALAGDNSLFIVNPTTPAQLFHLLRRQMLSPRRKPLIVFTPKGLLRHPACVSTVEELANGQLMTVIDDPTPPKKVSRLIFCSGRFFYDLSAERQKLGNSDTAIVRIEQLYPLDEEKIKGIIDQYQGVSTYLWVQEEPMNMGAWSFIHPFLSSLLPRGAQLRFIGRNRSASPAVGSHSVHKKEHTTIMQAVFQADEVQLDLSSTLRA